MNRGALILFILVTTIGLAACQATPRDPLFRLTLKVVDDEGMPVTGAEAFIGAERRSQGDESGGKGVFAEGVTDENGYFSGEVEAWNASQAGYRVRKEGYYDVWLTYRAKAPVRGKWQPWNPTIEVVLKRIRNPVPMYAKWMRRGLEIMDQPYAYDLQAGDWVAPHGKGTTADFIFTRTLTQRGPDDFDYELKITFSNPGDGIQRFPVDLSLAKEAYRTLVLYEAPLEGYLPEWILTRQRRPDSGERTTFDNHSGYFFRVRTILDENGKPLKALYGKIYGEFFQMMHYLNPDGTRNIEYDPKRNLLRPRTNRERDDFAVGP